ncbi:uncharacterized protein LOC141801711 [Halichoeres trimaculatus]|uniref:uncharacterized protein LOC141801711 n=1 Tax=Halichoeres trimaculatus TaxID=147232 RepID=UPI003D9EB012
MSADDFQTKYSSVMEGMLKSAVAETTKLFETMVDELKAEISQIKKENEDLKRKCSQFENATRQTTKDSLESESNPRKSDSSEKRDTAIQCDLVPYRAMLVEQCEPLKTSTCPNQEQPCGYDTMEYVWQEHNYENREGRSSQMAFILVKQNVEQDSPHQTVVKQEEDEPILSCGQDLGTKVVTPACQNENERPSTNQECTSAEMLQPLRNEEAQVGPELPNTEEDAEVSPQISEIRTQGKLITSKEHLLAVAQSWSEAELQENKLPSDGKLSVNEQMDAGCSNQLADKPTPPEKSQTNDELTIGKMSETETDQPVRRKRGRPPKKTRQKPVKQLPLPKCTSNSQQISLSTKDGASQAPSLQVSSTVTKPNTPTTKPPHEATPQSRERRTSATLQDAMLLVEAMNQSTDKTAPSSPQRIAATTQTLQTVHEVPVEPEKTPISFETEEATSNIPLQATTAAEALAQKEIVATKQQPAATPSCTDASLMATPTAATQTSVHAVQQQHPQVKPVEHSNRGDVVTRRIIVMSRSSAALMPCKFARKSATQLTPVVSTVDAAQNNTELPKLTPTEIPPVKPSPCSSPQKNVSITPNKSLPAPTTDIQPRPVSQPKIAILIPRQLSAVALKKQLEVIDLTTREESVKSSDTDVEPPQLIPSSQDVNRATTVTTAELTNTLENPEPYQQTMNEHTHTVKKSQAAVVRLTRLPFPMSTKDAAFLVSLHSSKTSKTQSSPDKDITKEEPPSVVISTPSETQVSSSEICINTKEANVVGLETSVLDDSAESGDVAAEHSTSQKEMDTAVQDPMSSSAPPKEQKSSAVIHLKSIKPGDTSDPHSQMTKAQFLAQLAVSPILQDQEEPPTGDSEAGDASCPMTSDETCLQENTLVAKLRRHLKTHSQARLSKTSQELCIETEILTASPKKPGKKFDCPDVNSQTAEPIPHDPRKQPVVNKTSPAETNNDTSPGSTKRSRICKDSSKPKTSPGEPAPVSPQRLRATGESTHVSPRRTCSGRDCVGTKNVNPTSESPRRSNSAREGTISLKRQIVSNSPRRLSPTKERASLRKSKTTTVQSRRTSSSKDSTSPKRTITSSLSANSETPKMTKTGSTLKTSVNESSIIRRRCTFSKVSPLTKLSRSESDVSSPRGCDTSADGIPTKGLKSDTNLHSAGWSRLAEDVRSSKTGGSTLAQKRKLGSSPNENLTGARCKRLTKAARTKAEATVQNKSLASSEGSRKLTVKSVWTPPVLTLCDTPFPEPKKSPNSTPIKMEIKTLDSPLVYPPSVSLHPIPVWAPPVVSPLQPLSVIGWRLLKNQCGECGRVLSSSSALESHVSLHTGHRPFSCKLCGKRFPDSKGLKRHGRVHRNGRIHICKQCGKGFVYSFGLTKHLQMVHSRIKPFVCQICNKGFFSKRDVEAHIRIHTGEKPFHCNLCEKKFARRTELNVHLRWHNGEKRHWCPYCGKGFLDINNLKRHKYTHTGEKPHSCPHCPKHFTQSGHLKKHVRNVHKIQ